ncbi:MAG TPA: hypothetical protein VKA64_00145 [Gammaproteobacteria bacterium]|nr:hypothetical protein [Gammaproteobacteria bacterium]
MPHSDDERYDDAVVETPGKVLAVTAEGLYLANLLLLPGPPFLVLVALALKHGDRDTALGRCHLRQTIAGSLWAFVLLVVVGIILAWIGRGDPAAMLTVVIIYLVCCHSVLILAGMVGLAKAMAGKAYRHPLIGRPCEA